MKKLILPVITTLWCLLLLTGCIAIGTGPKSQQISATLGQQLIDLQKAKTMGAMTDAEYETQKAKLLASTPVNNATK